MNTAEIAIWIAAGGLLLNFASHFRTSKKDTKEETAADIATHTSVMVKLESISQCVSDIKTEVGDIRGTVRDLRDRIIRNEESTKQAHKRMDTFEKRLEKCVACHSTHKEEGAE
jgi:septation ring formation regulator EzrA